MGKDYQATRVRKDRCLNTQDKGSQQDTGATHQGGTSNHTGGILHRKLEDKTDDYENRTEKTQIKHI